MSKIIRPIRCIQCRDLFTPRPGQRLCTTACVHRWHSATRKGRVPEAAVSGRKQAANLAIQRNMAADFGKLSDRELALYTFVWNLAWQRGYNTGVRQPRLARRVA